MGEVFRARDSRLDREVALKVLPQEVAQDHSRRERFEREAKAVAALNHPNIVAVHDIGEDQGILYIVSELVPGRTLRGATLPLRKPWRSRRKLPKDSTRRTQRESRIATSNPRTSW
jgi:serine/threonine protein kinase